MIFPKHIEKGDIIGVCAPSGGVTEDIKIKRTKNGALNLRNAGYEVEKQDLEMWMYKMWCGGMDGIQNVANLMDRIGV